MTIADKLEQALKLCGYVGNGITPNGTRKYYRPEQPNGPFYYLGKRGSLRQGKTIAKSRNVWGYCGIPTHEDADKMLARCKESHEKKQG